MNTIVIDCGASFVKGARICDGKIIGRLQKRSPVVHGDEPVCTPVQINALLPLVKSIILELGKEEKELRLCIANEMHGFLLAYGDGSAYTDYISWQKEYGSRKKDGIAPAEQLAGEDFRGDIRRTGMALRAGLPSCNLLYLAEHGFLETGKPLYFYTLGDYLIRALSGRQPICHTTNAAATGLYDMLHSDWNRRLIRYISKDKVIFPAIGEEELQFTLGNRCIHCPPAVGDQQAALLGSGFSSENELSFNLGTGSQVSALVKEPQVKEEMFSEKYQLRPYFNGMYLKTIPHLPAGRALNVYIRFFKNTLELFGREASEDEIWETLLKEESKGLASKLDCDMSFFENPVTDRTSGAITNIEEYSLTAANLMHAVFDSLVSNYLWAADILEPDRRKIEKIIFSGGVARKIQRIRGSIAEGYRAGVSYTVAEDETLFGLYRYGQESMEAGR